MRFPALGIYVHRDHRQTFELDACAINGVVTFISTLTFVLVELAKSGVGYGGSRHGKRNFALSDRREGCRLVKCG